MNSRSSDTKKPQRGLWQNPELIEFRASADDRPAHCQSHLLQFGVGAALRCSSEFQIVDFR